MNSDKSKALFDLTRRSPFWACFLVFLLLSCDYGNRIYNLLRQRDQLTQAMMNQARNSARLTEAQELERRLEAFSLELLAVSKTNAEARQIVQDFNIQWNPPGAAAQSK